MNDVAGVWIACGCACDRVTSDYGEDLVVQPALAGIVDPFRILVQVKGTSSLDRFQRKDSKHSLRVPTPSVFRWARSSDITVIVLWDVKKHKGLFAVPSEGFDDWRYHLDPSATSEVLFASNDQFEKQRASRLCWRARIRYFEKLVAEAHIADADVRQLNSCATQCSLQSSIDHGSKVPVLVCELLTMLGIVAHNCRIEPSFLQRYDNAMTSLLKRGERRGKNLRMMAITLAVLARVQQLSGHGMSIALARSCVELISKIFELLGSNKSQAARGVRV